MDVFMSPDEKELLLTRVLMVPENGRIVEWGSGGSTLAIANAKKESVLFDSVEHTSHWYDKVKELITEDFMNVNYFKREPDGDFHAFATPEEENPTTLTAYIDTPEDITDVDLFLVDGVARSSCLHRIADEGKIGCCVLLHDAERPWYNDARARFTEALHEGRLALLIKEKESDS